MYIASFSDDMFLLLAEKVHMKPEEETHVKLSIL